MDENIYMNCLHKHHIMLSDFSESVFTPVPDDIELQPIIVNNILDD